MGTYFWILNVAKNVVMLLLFFFSVDTFLNRNILPKSFINKFLYIRNITEIYV